MKQNKKVSATKQKLLRIKEYKVRNVSFVKRSEKRGKELYHFGNCAILAKENKKNNTKG